MSSGFILQKTKGFLQIPFSHHLPLFAGFTVAVGLCHWANSFNFVIPNSRTPEFVAEAAKIGSVATRIEVPPVYLNPISNGIPGNILGPEDME